ncbi:MAG: hypothetical protein NTY50_01055 [Methylobacter sp.]|nr:hypothetical protein [Methylobacter sp.]
MKKEVFEALIQHMQKHDIQHHTYIDKLTIYFDAKASPKLLNKLVILLDKNNLRRPCTLQNSIRVCQKLDLFQIDRKAFNLLNKICNSDADYRITYVEFALDFYGKNLSDLTGLRAFFNKHLIIKNKGKANSKYPFYYYSVEEESIINIPSIDEGDALSTHYFNEADASYEFIIYNQEEYRWDNNFACVHLEYKLKDSATLKKHGIGTLNDLVTFDHNSYWQQNLALHSPILKELGKQKSNNVSNQALNKNGNKIFKKMVSLQFYLNEDSTREKCFSPITTVNSLFKFLPELTALPDFVG